MRSHDYPEVTMNLLAAEAVSRRCAVFVHPPRAHHDDLVAGRTLPVVAPTVEWLEVHLA